MPLGAVWVPVQAHISYRTAERHPQSVMCIKPDNHANDKNCFPLQAASLTAASKQTAYEVWVLTDSSLSSCIWCAHDHSSCWRATQSDGTTAVQLVSKSPICVLGTAVFCKNRLAARHTCRTWHVKGGCNKICPAVSKYATQRITT